MTSSNLHPPEAQNLADSKTAFEKCAPDLKMALWRLRDDSYGDYRAQIGWATWQAREPEIEALKAELSACHAINDVANKEIEALRAQVMPEREVAVEIMVMALSNYTLHKGRFSYQASQLAYDALLSHMQRHASK